VLTPKERTRLAGLAQTREALVTLGRQGPTEALAARLDALLADHELVKLRFGDFKEAKRELAAELAGRTRSEVVRIVGHVAVFWRRNPDPERRKVELEP
jgi:RNA-binding protein